MSFKPSRSLISAELYVYSYFKSVAENCKSHKNEAPTPNYTCDLEKLSLEENDPQNKRLIDFYAKLIEFDKKKYEIKSGFATEEDVFELKKLEEAVKERLEQIKADDELWNHITNSNAGRHSLFHIINNDIMHESSTEPALWILNDFLTSSKNKNVKKALEYLDLIHDEKKIVPDNILIEAQLIFDSDDDPKNKIKKMETLIGKPNDIEKKDIPEETNQLIDIILAYSLSTSASESITDICLYGYITNRFVESGLLSQSLQIPLTAPSNRLFHQIFLQRRNIDSYLYHYTLNSYDSDCLLNKCLSSLTRKYVQLVNATDHTILTPELLVDLIDSADYLLQYNMYRDVSPGKLKAFWGSIIKIISRFEDRCDFLIKLDQYASFLMENNDPAHLRLLISEYLPFSEKEDRQNYQSLISAFQFINELNLESVNSSEDDTNSQDAEQKFKILITKLKEDKYNFKHLKSFLTETKISNISNNLKSKLGLAINKLKLSINLEELSKNDNASYTLLKSAIQMLAQEMAANKAEEQNILSSIMPENANSAHKKQQNTNKVEDKKKETQSRPPESKIFTPSNTLINLAKEFSKLLDAIEENIDKSSTTTLEFKEYVIDKSELVNLDESNLQLIDLLESLVRMLKRSEDSKNGSDTQAFEYSSEIASLILKCNQLLSKIYNNDPEIWKFILSNKEGRDALYFLISIDLDHVESNNRTHLDWKDGFLSDTSHPEETDLLQYLHCIIKYKLSPPAKLMQQYESNPYFQAYKVLSQMGLPQNERIKRLIEFASTHSLKINANIQKRIIRRVMDSLAYPLIMDIASFEANCDAILVAIDKLISKRFLPDYMKEQRLVNESQITQLFMLSYNYFKKLKIIKANYTLSNQFNTNNIKTQIHSILFMCISNYYILSKTNDFKELPEPIIKELILGIDHLIKSGYIKSLPPATFIYFWQAVLVLYSKLPKEAAHERLNSTLDTLYQQEDYGNALSLLQTYLNSNPGNTPYEALRSATTIIRRLPETDINESRNDLDIKTDHLGFIVFLTQIDQGMYTIDEFTQEFLARFDHISYSLKSSLKEKSKALKSMISAVDQSKTLKLRHFLSQIGEALEIDVAEYLNDNIDSDLREIEDYVLGFLEAVNKSYANDRQEEPSYPEFKPTIPISEEHEPLVHFYLDFINIIKLSHAVRTSRKSVLELIEASRKLYIDFSNLKNNHALILKNKLLSKRAGRHMLYFLLLDRTFLFENDTDITSSIIESLRSSTSDPGEIEILDYFVFMQSRMQDKSKTKNLELANKNRLIGMHITLQLKRKQDLPIKFNTLKKLTMTPLIFSRSVPDYIPIALQYINAQLFFSEIDVNDEPLTAQYLAMLPDLSESFYLPGILPNILMNNTQTVMGCIHNISQHMHFYLIHYMLQRINQASALHSVHISLQHQMISLFRNLKDRSWITNKIIKKYSFSACSILTNNSLTDIKHIQDFCKSIVTMLSFMEQANDFSNEVHEIISNLFISGKPDCAELILTYYIEHLEKNRKPASQPKKTNDSSEITKYAAFLSVLKLFHDISSLSETISTDEEPFFVNKPQSEIKKIIQNICKVSMDMNPLTLSFLNSRFPALKTQLKNQLIENIKKIDDRISFLKSHNDKELLKSFQTTILQLSRILDCNENELSTIKKLIYDYSDSEFTTTLNDPLFDSEVKSEPNKSKKRNKKKQINEEKSVNSGDQIESPQETAETLSETEDLFMTPEALQINIEPIFPRSATSATKASTVPSTMRLETSSENKLHTKSKKFAHVIQPKSNSKHTLNANHSKARSHMKSPSPTSSVVALQDTQKSANTRTSVALINQKTVSKPMIQAPEKKAATSTTTRSITRTLASVATFKFAPKLIHRKKADETTPATQLIDSDTLTTENTPKPIETLSVAVNDSATPCETSTLAELSTPTTGSDTVELFEETNGLSTDFINSHLGFSNGLEPETQQEDKKEENYVYENQNPLSFLTFFNNEIPDDLVVNRDLFPSEFLNFASDLYDITYPITQNDIYLTGGAITYLYEKENNPYDFDIIIKGKKADILPHLSRKYYCVASGLHEVIHVTIPAQSCDLISVTTPLTTNNLNELPITTTAAYVRTPEGLYYVNTLKNIFEQIPLDQAHLANFDRKLKPTQETLPLTDEELIKIRLMIEPYPCHVKSIEIDITCTDSELNEDLFKRDLTTGAGCIKLVKGANKFHIEGTPNVIYSLRNHIIGPVDPENIFFNDIVQLFRFAKTKLKHKKHSTDKILQNFIDLNDGQYIFDLFNLFLFNQDDIPQNLTHLRQIGSKLDELFSRFDTRRILEVFIELHIIEGMTSLPNGNEILETADILDNFLDTLPSNAKKMGFYYYLYTLACLSNNPINVKLYDQILMTLRPGKDGKLSKEQQDFIDNLHFIKQNASLITSIPLEQSQTNVNKNLRNFVVNMKVHFALAAQNDKAKNHQAPKINRSRGH